MRKLFAAISTVLISFAVAAYVQSPAAGQPPPKAKGKGDPKKKNGPGGELRKAYDLLRRLRADADSGRAEERIRDWVDRAAGLYRDGLRSLNTGDTASARALGTAAHDLARAADCARNASRFDRPDPDLPAPSDDFGLEDTRDRARRDLYRAYERLSAFDRSTPTSGSEFAVKAARDLYSAARRDLEAGRDERGGELARAAEAMTHVPEHLAQVIGESGRIAVRPGDAPIPPPARPEPLGKRSDAPERRTMDLPPALPPG
jgi:hypothetical protein